MMFVLVLTNVAVTTIGRNIAVFLYLVCWCFSYGCRYYHHYYYTISLRAIIRVTAIFNTILLNVYVSLPHLLYSTAYLLFHHIFSIPLFLPLPLHLPLSHLYPPCHHISSTPLYSISPTLDFHAHCTLPLPTTPSQVHSTLLYLWCLTLQHFHYISPYVLSTHCAYPLSTGFLGRPYFIL